MDPKERGKELATRASEALNTLSYDGVIEGFCDGMSGEHRTLQQSFTRLCLNWLYRLAHFEDYDDRNKASVILARKIDELLDLKHSKNLPCI